MEQVIFLHLDTDGREALGQIQHSPAQRLVLVAPTQMDRLRLNMLLRLARRATFAQVKQLSVVSENRLIRALAGRMGYLVASSLDEYHSLRPDTVFSTRQDQQQAAPLRTLPSPTPQVLPSADRQKPAANLERMLVDGYLPNPAATPGLEEEEERAEREEYERLHYEIADENHPSQAQQEAEEHEDRIVARILKTSASSSPKPSAVAPARTPFLPADATSQVQNSPSPEAAASNELHTEPHEEETPPKPPAPGGDTSGSSASNKAEQPPPSATPRSLFTQTSADAAPKPIPLINLWEQGLRPMPTIQALLHERGSADIFDWFEQMAIQAAAARIGTVDIPGATRTAGNVAIGTQADIGEIPPTPPPAKPTDPRGKRGHLRQPRQIITASTPGKHRQPQQSRIVTWQRIGSIAILAFSLLMACAGLALLPSAQVRYRMEITPYNETLVLDARPPGLLQLTGVQNRAQVPAQIARFDGVLLAQAPATGRRSAPGDPNHQFVFPTQADIDQAIGLLRERLRLLGTEALRAQQAPGDILGPAISDEQILASPSAGTTLPAGVFAFQVSLALHLRAALIRHQALIQATENRLRQDVNQIKPGLTLESGALLHLSIQDIEPAGPGEDGLELLVRIQASVMIGPALTPDQARSAIAGLSVPDAEAYLRRQPGITDASITVQPKWLNRLPIFSARIRINLES